MTRDGTRGATRAGGIVDVHHHFFTPRFIERTRTRFAREITGMPNAGHALGWTIARSIDAMDEAGVETAMLSLNQPGALVEGDAEASRTLARHCNEFAARAQTDHPGRFGHFASLPLPDIDASLHEIEHALDTLGADGFIVHTNEEDVWLGDPAFWPVYEELNRRGAVVYVHPALPGCCQQVPIASPPALLEYPFDTARAVTNLIYTGAANRFPAIRFIFSHGGGALPMLIDRIETVARIRPDLREHAPDGAHAALSRFFYDTAQVFNATAFAALRTMLPADRILFGTDIPFASLPLCVRQLGELVPDAAERHRIAWSNAAAILPRLDADARIDAA